MHIAHTRNSVHAILLAAAAALVVAGGVWAVAGPAAAGSAYPAADVTLTGHGYGPGIGMGQWGAFGYAVQYKETYQWILAHYYGGTTPASIGSDPQISVAITENDGTDIVLTSSSAFKVAGKSFAAGAVVRLVLLDASTSEFEIETGGACSGSGTWKKSSTADNPVAVPKSTSATATRSQVLVLCRADGVVEPLRGEIEGIAHDGSARTLNLLALDEYLMGVVPSEMPADWADYGAAGPDGHQWGFQALEAQAVAARSYAVAYYTADGGWFGYADICDSTDCQSYQGMLNENALSDAAVSATIGQILDVAGTKTAATTQYSASTGGYTAGGTFPAVPDLGDSICLSGGGFTCNPSHDWTASIPVATVEAAFPSVGTLSSVLVTERNGLGDLGGRVLEVEVIGSSGSVTVSGDDFAGDFGLLSNWFAVTNGPGGGSSGLSGYWLVSSDGQVGAFGSSAGHGSVSPAPPAGGHVVAIVASPKGGYWVAGAAGAVYSFGAAVPHGSMTGHHLNAPIVGMAALPGGTGYWLVASDGGIFAFGKAVFHGSEGGHHLNAPIVAMAVTPDGGGYWLVASDGGIFAFGDARFHGSEGGHHLNEPIVGMAATANGGGYWLVASDGGIFNFGDAGFEGSLAGAGLTARAVGMIPTPHGQGYEILTSDGAVHPVGIAPQYGDLSGKMPAGASAAGIAGNP